MMKKFLLLLFALLLSPSVHAQFDHNHTAWSALLSKHVRWLPDNKQSRVDYAAFKLRRVALKEILANYSSIPKSAFDTWASPQRMAFLINAYNAFTIELILTEYPNLKSIKDLGSFFTSPWQQKFFQLLGEDRTLDWIEHEQLRPKFTDPRVHAAVNCASIGCPALRDEAFTAAQLEAQLEDGMQRFMSDKTRNRMRNGKLEVSSIFKWFREDWEQGHQGFSELADLFAKYAAQLADNRVDWEKLRAKTVAATYLDYDWSLNVIGH